MRLLVTGAGGMLGRDVVAAARRSGHEVAGLTRGELDITDATAVTAAVESVRPEAVINCAAYTDVDGAEDDAAAAGAINGLGAGYVAAAAAATDAFVVHLSTDYVFDGSARRPYVESDPVGPRTRYGITKLAGERAVATAAPERHAIVRTAWLFGAGGRCFPQAIAQLAGERDVLPVVDDQIGCPTFTGHLAPALVGLAESREVRGVVHVAGAGRCSWCAFAAEIVRRIGAACEVRPVTSAEFPRPASRPAWSVLASERGAAAPRLPHWHDGLDAYLHATLAAS